MDMQISGVRVDYPGFVLGPVDLTIAAGEFCTLIDPNGSGKSTLIRAVLGLQRTVAGSVRIGGHPVSREDTALLGEIGYVTDSGADVLGEFSPREYWQYFRLAHRGLGRRPPVDVEARAAELAARLELPVVEKPCRDRRRALPSRRAPSQDVSCRR